MKFNSEPFLRQASRLGPTTRSGSDKVEVVDLPPQRIAGGGGCAVVSVWLAGNDAPRRLRLVGSEALGDRERVALPGGEVATAVGTAHADAGPPGGLRVVVHGMDERALGTV